MELDKKLTPYLEELDKTTEIKRFLINRLASSCDEIKMERPGSCNIWHFYFDDGAYKGGWWHKLRQPDITPLSVISMLIEIPWPAFKVLENSLNKAALNILKGE